MAPSGEQMLKKNSLGIKTKEARKLFPIRNMPVT